MLSNTWKRVAMIIAAAALAAAFSGVAQAAKNPVPANLKQQIFNTANKCHALFPSEKTIGCDLTGIKQVDDRYRHVVSAAKWQQIVKINAAAVSLCNSVAPYESAKLAGHNLEWSATGDVFQCYWGGNSLNAVTGMVSVQFAAPGHPNDSPTCFPDETCNWAGKSMFKQNKDTSPCASAINHHTYCNQWYVQSPSIYLQVTNWGWSDQDLAVHKLDYAILVSRLVAALGLATG